MKINWNTSESSRQRTKSTVWLAVTWNAHGWVTPHSEANWIYLTDKSLHWVLENAKPQTNNCTLRLVWSYNDHIHISAWVENTITYWPQTLYLSSDYIACDYIDHISHYVSRVQESRERLNPIQLASKSKHWLWHTIFTYVHFYQVYFSRGLLLATPRPIWVCIFKV